VERGYTLRHTLRGECREETLELDTLREASPERRHSNQPTVVTMAASCAVHQGARELVCGHGVCGHGVVARVMSYARPLLTPDRRTDGSHDERRGQW
jgi:hypothetical protein